jgi:DNA-binding CsgD family transcriptional regulator
MLEHGALPVDVALQLARSAVAGDEVAITTLSRASEALAATDPGASADLSRRALELAPTNHPLLGPLVARTATSLHAAGRLEDAKAFADNALREVLPAAQEAEVRFGIAGMWSVSPDVRVHAGRAALKLAPVPDELRVAHMSRLAYNLLVGGRPAEARVRLADATKAGARKDPAARFQRALTEAGLEYQSGRFATALDMFETVLRDGFADGHELDELLTRLWRADVLLALDQADEALAAADSMIADSQRRGLAFFRAVAEVWRGQLLLQTGRLHEASATLDDRFDAHTGPVVTVLDAAGITALGRVAVHMTDGRQIRRTSELAKTMIGESTPGVRRHAAWLLALQAMAAGDGRRAHQWLCTLGNPERKQLLPRLWTDVADEPQMVRIALAAGDHELAESATADAGRRTELNPSVPALQATAAHASALVNNDRDELSHAVKLFEQSPRPLALAAAQEDLALAHRRHGDQESEIDALNQALALFTDTGASHDASRLRNRLRELGIRRRVTRTERPAKGWAAMTKSELAVARLVAAGLTNREVAEQLFVSPHTVNSHLRQVFAKLEVNSRVDLSRLVVERDGQADRTAVSGAIESH